MENEDDDDSKGPRKQKKWTEPELQQILNYLKNNKRIEHPTAQIYYKRFLAQTNIKANWSLVKWKVRYLKNGYIKVEKEKQIISERGAAPMSSEKMFRICRYYPQLKEIFGQNKMVQAAIKRAVEKADSTTPGETEMATMSMDEESDSKFKASALDGSSESEATYSATDRHDIFSQSAFSNGFVNVDQIETGNPIDVQEDLANLERIKLHFEWKKFTEGLLLERYKFDAETNIKLKELQIKQQEIEKEERLRKLEIEKEERVAMYELNLKYNVNEKSCE